MNKTAIRNFAVWARNKLINDVTYRAGLMGVTADGIANPLQQSTDNVQFFDIGMSEPYQITGEEIKQRKSLVEIIKRKEKDSDYATAFASVVEEVAYTWFNRLIAIRFMEVNDYLPSHIRVLSSESGKLEPDLVTTPYDAELFFANGDEQTVQNLKNENKLDEVFRMLFIKQCNSLYAILPRLFENLSDYTELLLNVSFIDQDGVVYHLVHDIPEEDFNVELGGQVEIIGWLYQYYNAELKDETFALLKQNVKITKERVPSATQLFTPDWIVRYMVENSLGRLWLELHPNNSLKDNWKYYIEESEQNQNTKDKLVEIRKEYIDLNPEDIRIIDPCMGSGHILVYAFDILMQIYESAGWSQRDAASSIVHHNIYGLDIDDRAAQLAYFAVLMKARQYNRRILTEDIKCNVFAIQESNIFDRTVLHRLGDLQIIGEKLIDLFTDAKEYGSILEMDIALHELEQLDAKLDELDKIADYGNLFDQYEVNVILSQLPIYINQARIMIQKYHAVVTNPPYMGASGMTAKLVDYTKKHYPISKSDLSTVMMEKAIQICEKNGFISMINIPVWMFISSYEDLRVALYEKIIIYCMAHFGRGVFGSDFGTTSFVFRNCKIEKYRGLFQKLYSREGAVDSIDEKEKFFFDKERYYHASLEEFMNIPGSPLTYWVGENFRRNYEKKKISDYAEVITGMTLGKNDLYLRLWYEIEQNKIVKNKSSMQDVNLNETYWIPYSKGGQRRNWYGNYDFVVNWSQKDKFNRAKTTLQHLYLREAITWPFVTMGDFSARYLPEGSLWDVAGSPCFFNNEAELKYTLGLLCSKVSNYILKAINPTINVQAIDIARIPLIVDEEEEKTIIDKVNDSLYFSSKDWDSFETSSNFKKHPLI